MKKILLATLLSIAMSEDILMENLRPETIWIRDKQFWNRKIKRVPRNDIPFKIEEFSNYDDDRELPRISDTRFINEPRKLPSFAVIRRHDVTRFPQILSSDKSKFDKPAVMISIGIQEGKKAGDNSPEDCLTKKTYRKHNQGRKIQQPFYVEEPRWIEINSDANPSSRHLDGEDPYILSRGKRIFGFKDPEQAEKAIEDYRKFLNYLSRSERMLMKSRTKRSVESNEKTRMKKIDEMSEERKRKTEKKENINHIFIEKYKQDKLKNMAKGSHEFIKQNQTFANGIIMTNFIEQKQKMQRKDVPTAVENGNSKTAKINQDKKLNNRESHFDTDTNKRNKRSALVENRKFPEVYKKHKTHEIGVNFEKNNKRNKTDVYEQMKDKIYIDELDNLNTYDDPFVLSRGKHFFDSKTGNSNKENTNHKKSIERSWKIQHYAYRKKLKNKDKVRNEENESEIDKDDIGTIDSQLTNKSNSESSEIKNYRKKRNTCENFACKIESLLQDPWLNIEKEIIQDSLLLERRDKHNDILDDLRLSEPYIISRGKKAYEFENDLYSVLKSRNTDGTDRPKIINLLAKNLLRMLLMETRCNNDNCDMNTNRLTSKRSPRDRRGSLDEILAAYDPYYVARGKRMSSDNFFTKMRPLLRNQKSISYEIDTKQ